MTCRVLWASSNRMTVRVTVNQQNKIVDAAPVVRKFIGQHIGNLYKWMKRQGGLKVVTLSQEKLIVTKG